LQLDIITRAVELYTNKDEVVFTPFMGIGSEVYASVMAGRKGLGAELKPSYFRQAVKNLETTKNPEQASLDFNFGLDDIIKNIEGENDEY
jgi:DNA modification methylase